LKLHSSNQLRLFQNFSFGTDPSIKEAKSLPDFSKTDANPVRITLNGLELIGI
jgi:hypothetical protein